MPRKMKIRGFELNIDRLEKAVLQTYEAATEGTGIFQGGFDTWRHRFLPQWRLPEELEHNPSTEKPKDPFKAAIYLWTSMIFERQIASRTIHRRLKEVWYNDEKNWFFFPEQTAEKKVSDVERIVREDLRHPMNKPWNFHHYNAKRMMELFDGDPRKVIDLCTVDEAKERTMKFQGFGPGIANLNTIHYIDRGIAKITDPETALFKVDIHKGRFPINVGAIKSTRPDGKIHHWSLVEPLEKIYREICTSNSLDPKIADAAIWVLGAEGCTRTDMNWCYTINCPAIDLCVTNPPLVEQTGKYTVTDPETGRYIDRQRDRGVIYHPTSLNGSINIGNVLRRRESAEIQNEKLTMINAQRKLDRAESESKQGKLGF